MSDMQNPESQTRLSVIMFSDIVGYSKMMQENEELAMTLLSRHNQLVRDALKKHDGKEIKVIGDAFLVSFATVANAVRCAIDIQEQFNKYNENAVDKEKTQVRIGIHMGDIIVKDNDVFGDGVNIASRIEPLAEPGGICISQEVYNLVKHKLDLQVVSLGPKELKNIKDKIEIYEILVGSITSDAHKAKTRKKKRRNWLYAVAGLFVVAVGLLIAIKTLNKPASAMVTRILNTGGNMVDDPNISPDGNWIVYVAPDHRFEPSLDVIHASGGETRKVTNDSNLTYVTKTNPCFSPDASQIVYGYGSDIYIISTQGGTSLKLVSRGELPVWSPDGKHIAFFRQFPYSHNGIGLFIVNPDGTRETKLAQINPVFGYNVAWSPDARRLAFLRSFQDSANGQYSEIFSRKLDGSTEHQITFDKKDIDDFCWTSTGEIVFNSTRGGGVGLWVMPEEGGTPKQLTLGAGTDVSPRISKDARRLVYLNKSQTSNIWTIDLQTKQIQQVTFEDGTVGAAAYSSDGSKLVYWKQNIYEPSQDGLVICNKDGSEPTKFIPTFENNDWPWMKPIGWSVDMKSIFLCTLRTDTVRKNPDSIVVQTGIFEYDRATNLARKIGNGALCDISRDGKYVLYERVSDQDPFPDRTVLALKSSPDKVVKEMFTEKHSRPQFSWDSKSVITQDSIGIWITPVEPNRSGRLIKAPKFFHFVAFKPDNRSLLGLLTNRVRNDFSLVELNLVNGKVDEIATAPWKDFFRDGSVSPDGKTLAIMRHEVKNRIMVLDNFR